MVCSSSFVPAPVCLRLPPLSAQRARQSWRSHGDRLDDRSGGSPADLQDSSDRAGRTMRAMTHHDISDRHSDANQDWRRGRRGLGHAGPPTGRASASTTSLDVLDRHATAPRRGPGHGAARHRLRLRPRRPPRRATGATVAGIDASAELIADRPGSTPAPTSASARCSSCRGRTARSTPRSRSTASGAAAKQRWPRRSGCCGPAAGSASASGARARRSTSAPCSRSSHRTRRTPTAARCAG